MAKKKAQDETVASGVQRPVKKLETVAGSDVPTYYVNSVNVDLSSFDVRFRLAQIQSATDTVVQVKEIAHVFMSHNHFKAFVAVVNNIAKKMAVVPEPIIAGEEVNTH